MTTNNACNTSSIRLEFADSGGTNHSPSPMMIYPIPRIPTPANPPSSEPVIKTQQDATTNSKDIPHETADIFDYMIWSGVNVVVGGILLGIPSLILSIITRKYKRKANVKIAKRLSRVTLGFNIFVSFLAMIGLVYLITHFNNPY